MNRLATDKRTAVVAALVEGTSINATCRITGVAKHTVLRLLKDLGCACAAYHDAHVRNLRVRCAQADEIWAFIYAKQKNVTAEQMEQGAGDVWTWTAIDADTKLIISYMLGDRGAGTATAFMQDAAARIANRVQLTTDGHHVYVDAVEDPNHISTSFVERSNLSMRMGMRRFTRLTNGFSKKLENHGHMVALYFFHYNFIRIHKTLRVTPAMEAGITDHVWSFEELLALLESEHNNQAVSKKGN